MVGGTFVSHPTAILAARPHGLAAFVATLPNVEHVDVLPFHRMGAQKYAALGRDHPPAEVEPPSAELLGRVHARFRAHGVTSR